MVLSEKQLNVMAMTKGDERYIFMFYDEYSSDVLRILGRFASNPELSFTWYDAAAISKRIREESKQCK